MFTAVTSFTLRDVDESLMRAVKVRAAQEGLSMKAWILAAIFKCLSSGAPVK